MNPDLHLLPVDTIVEIDLVAPKKDGFDGSYSADAWRVEQSGALTLYTVSKGVLTPYTTIAPGQWRTISIGEQ